MGERKVLNKYFPPDFDPADLPRGQRAKDNAMKVRMMLPMTIRCKTCGEFMYKGTKFNCKKEDVVGEKYLGMQIFRFYMHCRKCSAEITYCTDPANLDYKMEHGATRNFEAVKHEQSIEEALKSKRAAEDEDKLRRIENKTADAKREMDIFDALDDMMHVKGQLSAVSTDAAIAALKAKADEEAKATGTGDLTEADEDALRLMVEGGRFTKRLEDEDEGKPSDSAPRRLAAPVVRKKTVKVQPAVKRKNPAAAVPAQQQPGDAAPEENGTGVGRKEAKVQASVNGNTGVNGEGEGKGEAGVNGVVGGPKVQPEQAGDAKKATSAAPIGGLGLGNYSSSSSSDGDQA